MADDNEEVKSPLSFAQRLQQQTTESQRLLDEHRRRLMGLISSRQQMPFDPALMKLAAGLLAPTKTGSFGESLGYGVTGYAEEMEKQLRRQQEEAKMGYELELQSQQQKRDLMGQQLLADMFSGEVPEAGVAPVAALPAGEVMEPVAKVPTALGTKPVGVKLVEPEKPTPESVVAAIPELKLPEIPRNRIARMTDEQIAMLKSFNPTMGKILEDYRTAFRQNRELQIKEVNLEKELQQLQLSKEKGVREERETRAKETSVKRYLPGVGAVEMPMSFWSELQDAKTIDEVKSIYNKNNLPLNIIKDKDTGLERFMTDSERELRNRREEARFSQAPIEVPIPELGTGKFTIDRVTWDDYRKAKTAGKDALQEFFNNNFPEAGVRIQGAKVKPSGEAVSRPQSAADIEAERSGAVKTAEKRAEAAAEQEQMILTRGDAARERILLAQDLERFARDPSKSKVMALLERATPESALGKLLAEGVSVGTFRVGVPQLREVLLQAGMGATDTDVSNLQQLGNIYTRLMFAEGNLFQGQGAVSDYERRMQERMGGTVQDTPQVAQARAQYVITRANFDKAVANDYYKWLEKNPNGTFQKYKRDAASKYESIESTYMNRIRKIGDTFFPDMSTGRPSAPTQRPARSGSAPSSNAPSGNVGRFMQ